MNPILRSRLVAVLVWIGVSAILAPPTVSAYTVPTKMAWWYDARFGMFIHFGSYSYYGKGEWAFSDENWSKSAYQTQISANFNPVNFDATAIAASAKAAGMKYLVITAKHHEGFAMWNTSVPSFTDVPGTTLYDLYHYTVFKRDVLAELKAACAAQGIKFCLYYSILDWNHSSQTISKNGAIFSTMSSLAARTAYIADMKAQLNDLITKYDPDGFWFDGDWCGNPATPTLADWWTVADGQDLYNYLIGLKPTLVINERVKRDYGLGDYACAEGGIPSAPLSRIWEACVTMNGAWGYQSTKDNSNSYRSVTTLIREMVQVISRNGNYLLNIGPKGDGSVPVLSANTLAGIGTWMNIYSESIYGTSGSPYSTEPSWGYFTQKPGKLYAHVITWPTNGQLSMPALKNTISRAYSLANPTGSLSYASDSSGIVVTVPMIAPNSNDSVIVLEMTGTPVAIANRITTGGTATASAQNLPSEGADGAFDGTTATKWFTNAAATTAWLQYQFPNGWGWTALQYQIASANDVSTRDPKDWQLRGSNDGVVWNTLDTRSAQTFSGRNVTNTYTVTTPGNYRFYQLAISAYNGSTFGTQLSEFALLPNAADLNDTTAPVLTMPSSMTVPATSAAGAVVNFTASATDAVNGNPTVVCSPVSGSLFPVGTTFVQCSTSDFAGNGVNSGFYVNVVDPSAAPPATPTGLSATPGVNQVALTWSAVPYAISYKLSRASSANGPYTPVFQGNATNYTNASLPAGTAFYYTVSASNTYGESAPSTPLLSGPTGLPATWASQDIVVTGVTLGPAGTTTVAGGVFSVSGSGADIWGTSDGFQFAYMPWTGDGALVARVSAMTDTDQWAKAGVMFRESLAADAKNSFVAITPRTANGAAFQGRSSSGSFSTNFAGILPPYWVKLVRKGNGFTAFRSADGTNWIALGSSVQNAMGPTLYAGLAVTSHTTTALCTASFDNVAFVPPPTLTVPANIVADATSPSGAAVTFSVTATSSFDGALAPVSTPAAGSTFLIGTTTVQCSATDSSGLVSTATFTVTVNGPPNPPAGLAAATSNGSVSVSWNASPGATSYVVSRSGDGISYSPLASGVTGLGYVDATVVNGNTYFYKVASTNAAGAGQASSSVTATPIGPENIVPAQMTLSNGTAQLTLATSISGRTYQLQRSYTLATDSWVNLGTAKAGGGPLSFNDTPDPVFEKVFYRFLIGP